MLPGNHAGPAGRGGGDETPGGRWGRYMTVFYIYKTRYIVIYFPHQLPAPGVAWVGCHVVPAAFRAVRLVTPSLA